MVTLPVGSSPGPGPAARLPRPWWEKHLTLDRLILIVLLLVNSGRWWQGQQFTNASLADQILRVEERLSAAESKASGDRDAGASTYMRADVMRVWMESVNLRLASIEHKIDEQQKGGGR